jgi:HD-like signal output (HDOD) protein
MPNNAAVEKVIARVGDLPAMPAMVAQVLRLTDDPTTAMSEVSAALETDPAMTAKILRVSNSSYYGMKQFVGTLKLALVILGVREVRNIVLGISVFESVKGKDNDAALAQEVWDRSLMVAGLSKRMGQDMGLGLQGEEFIAGLLSDIGKMVLLRQLGAEYKKLLDMHHLNPLALCAAELQEFGYTHADVATALAHKWNLPQPLSDALWCQYAHPERPLSAARDPKLAALVRVAKAAVYDDFASTAVLKSLDSAEAWDILSLAKAPVPQEQRLAYLTRCVKELETAPQLPM